ncbi:MBL fold metallo-hydrolase [Moorena producens]|uniref:MBL fold metallo-hydrolase n=1 Tax=Moorena producens TaxID=1155739 RepID=UPI003C77709D
MVDSHNSVLDLELTEKQGEAIKLVITRVCNACILMEIGSHKILTDPFFLNPAYMGIDESVAIKVKELPRLSAIIGGHSVPDHWQIDSLSSYPYKQDVPVYVATQSMALKAISTGFKNVEVLDWGSHRKISETLNLEVVKAHQLIGLKANNYVLRDEGISVFFGSEARDLEPLREYRVNNEAVDIVIAPVNAVHLFGFIKLVMSGSEAIEATRILGAKIFFEIHDAHRVRPFLISVKSSGDDAEIAAQLDSEIEVVRMPTGQKWQLISA